MNIKELCRPILIAIPLLFLFQCYADPTDADIERVKQQFLVMRFHAPFTEEWRYLSDKELFEQSCKNTRIRCDIAIEILKKQDEKFYNTLMKENNSN